MALLDEILKWTEKDLPDWQRDAVRRLFQKEDGLSKEDYDELYDLMKSANGLSISKELVSEPLKASHLPKEPKKGETVTLRSMYSLKHVNCIAPGAKLSFASSGMTVVYGGNGSGKSGYTRVMKRACRARDQAEKVHPDANDPDAKGCVSEATFEIEINGASKPVQWSSDGDPPDELAMIAVFDSHCARAYLTAEQDVAFLPFGLDVVENLANKVLPELSRRLDEETNGIDIDSEPYEHLKGETEVGRLIAVLNGSTDLKKIKSLGTLSEKENKRIEELSQALNVPDPSIKANELRLSARRIKDLAGRIRDALAIVNDDAVNILKEIDGVLVSANQAEKQAAEVLQAGETLLPGTGEQVWKALFNAARKFSTEVAYPEHEFPHATEGAVCLLCQQTLKDGGGRLIRFEEYIQNNVAKAAVEQRRKVETEKGKIERANLRVGLEEALAEELEHLDKEIASSAKDFETKLEARQTWILEAFNSHTWDGVPILDKNPCQRLRDITANQLKLARSFSKAADATKRKALTDEYNEIHARENLSKCLPAVLALIERMKKKKDLESCKKNLNTKSISNKSKVFADSAVTTALKSALDSEFKALGIGHIKTKLKDRNEKGKVKHRLLLDLPTACKLEEILSEGEQRAIALGSFLAELELANHSGGIVFDDPVTSLEHNWRGRVAKRFAKEAQTRQVLIFTHDVVFLHQLCDECEKLNATPSICSLEMVGGLSGNVSEGLPWDHMGYKERIDKLEKTQKYFEKLPWPPVPSSELARKMIQQYSFLRATIERVVESIALNSTVQRFSGYINVGKLKQVVKLEQAEVDEILRLIQRCHDLTEAHDPSSAKNEPPPTPDDLKKDIEDLNALIQKIKDKRK